MKLREKLWQWIFKLLAALFIALLVFGVGPAPGGVAWSFDEGDQVKTEKAVNQQEQSEQVIDAGNQNIDKEDLNEDVMDDAQSTGNSSSVQSMSISIAQDGAEISGVNPIAKTAGATGSVPETEGPISLTYGDLDLTQLPKGIMKMPDASLWVIGVGPVNDENLNNPKWAFSEEEKNLLKKAVAAQRIEGIPNTVTEVASDTANGVGNALQRGADAAGEAANAAGETASNVAEQGQSTIMQWFQDITGIGLPTGTGGYDGGFLGITPYT